MTNCPTIRRIRPTDLDAVLAIAAASPQAPRWSPTAWAPYLAPDPGITPGAPHLADVARCGTKDRSTLLRAAFIAVDGSGVLGFACATLLLDGQENRAELDSMAVHPAARRRGLGSNLLRAAVSWSAAQGAHSLTLEVRVSNTAAIALYQRFGLRPEGRRPRYYADPEEDALLLATPVTIDSILP